jgi:hypothetical protein
MANPRQGRLIAAILVLIGAILLIVAVFMPWYAFKEPIAAIPGASVTSNTYPGFPSQSGTVQYSCSGFPSSVPCPSSTSYNGAALNNTAVIAETGFFLLIVGFVIGIIGTIIGVMSRGTTRRVRPALALSAIAMILAVITPVLFAAALPGAVSKDLPKATGSGPWSSFIGSSSGASWGPAIGWYIAFVAFVILLIGVILFFLYRKEPTPAAAPAPAPASPTTPPAQ